MIPAGNCKAHKESQPRDLTAASASAHLLPMESGGEGCLHRSPLQEERTWICVPLGGGGKESVVCEAVESIEGRMQTICSCQGQVAELKPAGK